MKISSARVPESDLIPIIRSGFLGSMPSDVNYSQYQVVPEFRSQYGIPDLVFYNFDANAVDQRIKNSVEPILSREIIKTLLLISGKDSVTLSYLESNLGVSRDVLKSTVLRYLIINNYLNVSNCDPDTYWIGDNVYKSCMDSVLSIEAKVSDWQRGFYQAYRYKWFSNFSFLILHSDFVKPAISKLALFEQYNVGLMSVSTEGKSIEVLYKPRKEKPYSEEIAALTYEKLFSNYCRERQLPKQHSHSS